MFISGFICLHTLTIIIDRCFIYICFIFHNKKYVLLCKNNVLTAAHGAQARSQPYIYMFTHTDDYNSKLMDVICPNKKACKKKSSPTHVHFFLVKSPPFFSRFFVCSRTKKKGLLMYIKLHPL